MKKTSPDQLIWIKILTPSDQEFAENLPLRRDVVTLLTYLRDYYVIGTQPTGNLPLKSIREVTAYFVNPPLLDSTLGIHAYHLRSENDVLPLLFIHLLANFGSLLEGGPSRHWLLTREGEKFLKYPPGGQIAVLASIWWKQMDWVIAFPYEGLRKGLPLSFKDTTRTYLQELPVETHIPADEFVDKLIVRTGLTWGTNVESSQTILRGAICRMVLDILGYLGIAEIEHQKDESTIQISSFKITTFGQDLLKVME